MKKTITTLLLLLFVTVAAMAATDYSKELEEKAIIGDADAMIELSTCYRLALGVKKDIDKANYWIERAAMAGNTQALAVITGLGDKGTGLSDKKRREIDAQVQRERQRLNEVDDPTIDYSTFNYDLYNRAQNGYAKAQYHLGDCYYEGKGVSEDYEQAVFWYRKAAEQGYVKAQHDLGYCYQYGKGVEKDYEQAVYWYRKAADQGNASAQNNLGYCYRHGLGVPEDNEQAVQWYRKAAEQGYASAQFNLAFCYENGYGVPIDITKAVEWYRKAAREGNENAQSALRRLGDDGKITVKNSIKSFSVKGVSFAMVYVEGGTFTMGATSEQEYDAEKDEKPAHSVTLSSYYIGQTEVTQELWQAVMGNNPSFNKDPKLPVENVSWDDCQEFLRKLNAKTGKKFRLPTEAEWEFAARGGNYTLYYKYSGSNYLDEVAWYEDNSDEETHTVATKRANELGIYDMSGNVWEWCSDWKGNYSDSDQTNPQGPSTGYNRVRRGCGLNSAKFCRVSYRSLSRPSNKSKDQGLRIVL